MVRRLLIILFLLLQLWAIAIFAQDAIIFHSVDDAVIGIDSREETVSYSLDEIGVNVTSEDDPILGIDCGLVIYLADGAGVPFSLVVEENDVLVSSPTVTIDFRDGFDVTESPTGEANVVVDPDEVITAGDYISWSGHTLNVDLSTGVVTQAYSVHLDDLADGTLSKSKVEDSGNWDTAFGWGDHSGEGYIKNLSAFDTDDLAEGVVNKYFPGFTNLLTDYGFTDNSSDWDTAFGWDDHSIQGYLTDLATGTITQPWDANLYDRFLSTAGGTLSGKLTINDSVEIDSATEPQLIVGRSTDGYVGLLLERRYIGKYDWYIKNAGHLEIYGDDGAGGLPATMRVRINDDGSLDALYGLRALNWLGVSGDISSDGLILEDGQTGDSWYWIGTDSDNEGDDDDPLMIGKGNSIGVNPYITIGIDGDVSLDDNNLTTTGTGTLGNLTSSGLIQGTTIYATSQFKCPDGTVFTSTSTFGGAGGIPGGADKDLQYNDGGSFNGISETAYNKTNGNFDWTSVGDFTFSSFSAMNIGVPVTLTSSFSAPISTKVSTCTVSSDEFTILCNATGGAFTVNLPSASAIIGRLYVVKKIDSSGNAITIDGKNSETIDGATTITLSTEWSRIMIQSDGTNWVRID